MSRFNRHAALPVSYYNTDFYGSCATVFQGRAIVVGHINTARRNKAFWLNGTQVQKDINFITLPAVTPFSGILYLTRVSIVTARRVRFTKSDWF